MHDKMQTDGKVVSLWILLLSGCILVHTQVYVTPERVLVDENGPATLTCVYNGSASQILFTMSIVNGDIGGSDDTTVGAVLSPGCSWFLNNPISTEYMYTCTSNNQLEWTIKHVKGDNAGQTWACSVTTATGTRMISNGTYVNTRVPIQNVYMTEPLSGGTVDVDENRNLHFECMTDGGRPIADIRWYKDNGTPNSTKDDIQIISHVSVSERNVSDLDIRVSALSLNPSRSDNGNRIYCSANNTEDQEPVTSSRKPLLNVRYSPDGPPTIQGTNGDVYRVIENNTGMLTCASSGGNPLAQLSWSCFTDSRTNDIGTTSSIVYKTVTWLAVRNSNRKCTCTSTHVITGSQAVSVNVDVLYPPNVPTINYRYGNKPYSNITSAFSVLEGSEFVLDCQTTSNPKSSYTWVGNGTQHSTEFNVGPISRHSSGVFICKVVNTMIESNGSHPQQEGMNSASVTANVLFPPEVLAMPNQTVVERRPFSYTCPYEAGNPRETNVSWSRDGDQRKWTSATFEIKEITITDRMMYTCTVQNTMEPTNQSSVTIPRSGSFFLDVQYKTRVTDFSAEGKTGSPVIVDTSASVTLVCRVDSNPASNISMSYGNELLGHSTNLFLLRYNLTNVTCEQMGQYTCEGENYLGSARRTLDLRVKCPPQRIYDSTVTFYSARDEPFSLSLSVLAYPDIISVVVTKIDGAVDMVVQNSSHITLTKSKLYRNGREFTRFVMSFHNVTVGDFGKYEVLVLNPIGKLQQVFTLREIERPGPPQYLSIDGITSSEMSMQWQPGHDGGTNQMFVLQYKRTADSEWTSVSIKDAGNTYTKNTIRGLDADTDYDVRIYSTNRVGNSSFIAVRIHTQAVKTKSESLNYSWIIGVVVGIVFFLAFAIGGILLARRFGPTKGTCFEKHSAEGVKPAVDLGSDAHTYMELQPTSNYINPANEYEDLRENNESTSVSGSSNKNENEGVSDRDEEYSSQGTNSGTRTSQSCESDNTAYINMKLGN